jgi:hypothetical protein
MDVANVENAGAFFHKKVFKRKPAQLPLNPALLAFNRGRQKGLVSLWQCAASLPRP